MIVLGATYDALDGFFADAVAGCDLLRIVTRGKFGCYACVARPLVRRWKVVFASAEATLYVFDQIAGGSQRGNIADTMAHE